MMLCPHCAASTTTELSRSTVLSLPDVPLPRLSADVYTLQPSAGAH